MMLRSARARDRPRADTSRSRVVNRIRSWQLFHFVHSKIHADDPRICYYPCAFRREVTLANLPPEQGGRQSADATRFGN